MLVCSRCMYGWSVRSAVDTYMFALVLVSMVRAMYHIESMLSYLWYVWYLSYLWYVSRFRVTVLVHYAVQYFWFHQSCMFHDFAPTFLAGVSTLKLQRFFIRIYRSQRPLLQMIRLCMLKQKQNTLANRKLHFIELARCKH